MSNETTALATRSPAALVININDRAVLDNIRNSLMPKASDAELHFFAAVCNRSKLDPFQRQIYGIHRWNAQAGREVMVIQVGIDGFRAIAEQSKDYAGQDAPEWCDKDGKWTDVWLSDVPPAAARVKVYRKGSDRPIVGIVTWKEFCQTTKDGSAQGLWKKMPSLMLAKCAEAQALRKAFPADLAGIQTSDEPSMDTLKNVTPKVSINNAKPVQGRDVTEDAPAQNAAPAPLNKPVKPVKELKPLEKECHDLIAELYGCTSKAALWQWLQQQYGKDCAYDKLDWTTMHGQLLEAKKQAAQPKADENGECLDIDPAFMEGAEDKKPD